MYSLSRVNINDPLVKSHPLNQGRVAWWITLPQNYGSPVLYDLCQHHYPASLTPNNTSTHYYSALSHPGGLATLSFDGKSGCFTGPSINPGFNDITISVWFKTAVSGTITAGIAGTTPAFGTVGGTYGLSLVPTGALRALYINLSGSVAQAFGSGYNYGTWHHATMTTNRLLNSGNLFLYVDGFLSTVGGAASISGNVASTNSFLIGAETSGTGSTTFFNGSIDSVSVWSRALSPQEVYTNYVLSQAGYPGVLNNY